MEKEKIIEEIIEKIKNRWEKMQKDFYVCYSVYDLAYKIIYNLMLEYYNTDNIEIVTIYYKKYNGKFKIAVEFEEDIFLMFDIWSITGMYGDSGLKCGNGKIKGALPKGYEILEEED